MGGVTAGELPVGANVASARPRGGDGAQVVDLAAPRGDCGRPHMPTSRAARAAARAATLQKLIELPADVLGLVLYQLPLAHDIALTD